MDDDADLIVDLFGGPGGWDLAAAALGLHVVGIEWDAAACATRAAAGLVTIRADVAQVPLDHLVGRVRGVIASPPCQMFSAAGSKAGRGAVDLLGDATRAIMAGDDARARARTEAHAVILADLKARALNADTPERRAELSVEADELAPVMAYNACLVLEPARFVHTLEPEWVALEQVPAVLPLWQELARLMRERGYRTWVGILNAADYGVPQTRRRAVLMAHRDRPMAAPEATHDERPEPSLFGPELQPWVTMAAALGWTGQVGFPRRDDKGGDGYRDRDLFPADGAAPTVTEKARSWSLQPGGQGYGPDVHRREYDPESEPAPTIAFGRDAAGWRWVEVRRGPRPGDEPGDNVAEGFDPRLEPAQTVTHRVDRWQGQPVAEPVLNTGRDWQKGGTRADAQQIPTDRPAPTVSGQADAWEWQGGLPEGIDRGMSPEANAPVVSIDRPAPTVTASVPQSPWRWIGGPDVDEDSVVRTGRNTMKHSRDVADMVPYDRSVHEPAPTVTSQSGAWKVGDPDELTEPPMAWKDRRNDQSESGESDPDWPLTRPATTIAGRDLVPDPGANANRFNGAAKSRNDGYRVQVWEAAVLQSFPHDYPWQGVRTKQFEQVGNAVPPLLALHVLATVTGLGMPEPAEPPPHRGDLLVIALPDGRKAWRIADGTEPPGPVIVAEGVPAGWTVVDDG